ncbi:MAG: NADH:flavin oxidoreductase/NADH oxidase family protein [Marinicella sp.]|nr:NADH:flavin oxidoreductase/NADH oxidase family protein [Xanthomonadales bacterium]
MTKINDTSILFKPFILPGGQVIPNRIVKASMEENMADNNHLPGTKLINLYKTWATGGSGLLLTGNVMVADDAVTGPGGIVLDVKQPLEPFKRWAKAGKIAGGKIWMQINHPGRQVYIKTNPKAIAPSAVPIEMGTYSKLFTQPRAMTENDIAKVINQFVVTAELAEQAGFDGVEIHAAHGYLLSQFLSPLTNLREDQWGGSLENRARILIEIIKNIRMRVSPKFGVGVKLNSADFQKGGFNNLDAIHVVKMLGQLPVDLVEISGGSYESPAMQGAPKKGEKKSTYMREAYFVDFAREIQRASNIPIMVTGGIKRRATALKALMSEGDHSGVALVGIARALAYVPDLANRWKQDEWVVVLPEINFKKKALNSLARMGAAKYQLRRLGRKKVPKLNVSPMWALILQQLITKKRNKHYRAWLKNRHSTKVVKEPYKNQNKAS